MRMTSEYSFKLLMLFAACALVSNGAWAQEPVKSFEDYKKQQEAAFDHFKSDYQRGLDSIRSAHDKAFSDLLNNRWVSKELDLVPSPFLPDAPPPPALPDPSELGQPGTDLSDPPASQEVEGVVQEDFVPTNVPPIVTEDAKPSNDDEIIIEEINVEESLDSPLSEQSVGMPEERVEAETYVGQLEKNFGAQLNLSTVSFFSIDTRVPQINSKWPKFSGRIEQKAIVNYWSSCADSDYSAMLAYFEFQRQVLKLNDWAYIRFIDLVASKNFSTPSEKELFKWFVLVQSGFDVHLMYSPTAVYLTYPFEQVLYAKSFFELGQRKYYLLESVTDSKLYTYDDQHENATDIFSLEGMDEIPVKEERATRRFQFYYAGKNYDLSLTYNPSRIDLYKTLPQSELALYFDDKGAHAFELNVQEQLGAIVDALPNDLERVRFLHKMVMDGIPYETDQEQFGYEKFCMPEEVLAYPYADCEDRSTLLNYLITSTTNVKVIGLNYPQHIATAVGLKPTSEAQTLIEYKGLKYIYCDPTYIGSDVGQMPDNYRGLQPTVIE